MSWKTAEQAKSLQLKKNFEQNFLCGTSSGSPCVCVCVYEYDERIYFDYLWN